MLLEMSDKIYFPVEDVCLNDLRDWSDSFNRGLTTTVTMATTAPPSGVRRRSLRRQNSVTGTLVDVNLQQIALFRYLERVYAVSEKCPHAGGPLHVGDIEVLPDRSVCVRCPWHSWCFDLDTGKVKRPQGRALNAVVFPTKVTEDGQIFVGFDSFSPKFFTDESGF